MPQNSESQSVAANRSFLAKAGDVFKKVRDTLVDGQGANMAIYVGTSLPLAFNAPAIASALQTSSVFSTGAITGITVAAAAYSALLLSKMASNENKQGEQAVKSEPDAARNKSFLSKAGGVFGKVRDTIIEGQGMNMAVFLGTAMPLALNASSVATALQTSSVFSTGMAAGVIATAAAYSGLLLSKMASHETEQLEQQALASVPVLSKPNPMDSFFKSDGYAKAGSSASQGADVTQANTIKPSSGPRM